MSTFYTQKGQVVITVPLYPNLSYCRHALSQMCSFTDSKGSKDYNSFFSKVNAKPQPTFEPTTFQPRVKYSNPNKFTTGFLSLETRRQFCARGLNFIA